MSEVRTGGRGPCPECSGKGETRLGPLTFSCPECAGAGQVGGDDQPLYCGDGWKVPDEGEEYDPAVHGPLAPVGTHPAVTASALCPTCLGSRVVSSSTLIEAPCPACSAGGER
jgi:hypothetical protein